MANTAPSLMATGVSAATADRLDNTRDGINVVNNATPVTSFWALGYVPLAGTSGTSVTATNTTFYIAELFIPVNITITGLALLNAAAAAGNVQLALYDTNGILVASTASTAQAGTNVLQSFPLTTPYAAQGPARYHVMATFSSSSATFLSVTLGLGHAATLTSQVYGTLPGSITVPTTFAASAGPIIGTY